MNLKQSINKQFQNPTGMLGMFAGWAMAIKNKERAKWTYDKINFKPSDIILEIGYGPGTVIKRIAKNLFSGKIFGIDFSKVMFKQASNRNKKYIEIQKVKLTCGTIWDVKFPENYFDIIFASNVHFFWKNTERELAKLKTYLKPNGKLIFVFQPRWAKDDNEIKGIAEKNKKQFENTGFKNIKIEYKKMKPVNCIYICGRK